LGVKVVPEVTPLALKPAPETVTLETVTLEFPVFVKVTLEEPLPPTFTLPKFRLVDSLLVRRSRLLRFRSEQLRAGSPARCL